MQLTYNAIDAAGQTIRDSIEAASQREAVDALRRRGLYVTQIHDDLPNTKRLRTARPAPTDGVRLPLKTLAQMTRQLAMLLKSGSGIVPAMRAIRRQMSKPRYAEMFDEIIESLEDGIPLTDALRKHPRTFDAVFCGIVAAGEASGSLTEMFERLASIVMKRRAMFKKVTGALAYPALLTVMSVKILLVVLLFVLPRFSAMFDQLGVEVPATTRVLLNVGDFVRGYWPVILGVVALAVVGVSQLIRRDGGRQWISNIQTSIPLIGRLRSRLIQGEVLRTMGTLIESRVGVLESLELARRSTRNRKFQQLFDDLEEAVTSGGRMSTAFESSGIVEPYICQAIHTGEDSGQLGEAIMFCADNLDETNEELIQVITRLLEPIILIVMGFVVGTVAISLFVPLFDMTSAM